MSKNDVSLNKHQTDEEQFVLTLYIQQSDEV